MSSAATPPSMTDFLEAANAVYSQNTSLTPGLTPLLFSPSSELSDGFYAEAFLDSTGQVIIAFEGTNPTLLTPYGRGTLSADLSLFLGGTPQALTDAVTFAEQVIAADGSSANGIYVTGHSLGGAEAEEVDATLGLGGVTFGAPGITTQAVANNLVDYVDYGDPVGNLGTDTQAGADYTLPRIRHVGQVVMVGTPSNGTPLIAEGEIFSALTKLATSYAEAGILLDTVPPGSLLVAGALLTDVGAAVVGIFQNHLLQPTYIPDLGYYLSSNGSVLPLGPTAITTPPQLAPKEITCNVSYSSFSDVLSSSGQLQQLTADMTDGTSDVINFNTSGGTYQSIDNIYNASAQLAATLQVNNDYSQTDTIYNVSGTDQPVVSEVYQLDSSGNLTSITENFSNGNALTLAAGTYSGLSFDTTNNALDATLTTQQGAALGSSIIRRFHWCRRGGTF